MCDMKEFIEQKLAECGYTNIEWHYGREGYFVLVNRPNEAKSVVNISRFVNDLLWLDEKMENIQKIVLDKTQNV